MAQFILVGSVAYVLDTSEHVFIARAALRDAGEASAPVWRGLPDGSGVPVQTEHVILAASPVPDAPALFTRPGDTLPAPGPDPAPDSALTDALAADDAAPVLAPTSPVVNVQGDDETGEEGHKPAAPAPAETPRPGGNETENPQKIEVSSVAESVPPPPPAAPPSPPPADVDAATLAALRDMNQAAEAAEAKAKANQ